MNGDTYPDTPAGRRAKRAAIQALKEKIRKNEEATLKSSERIRKLEAAITQLPKLYGKLSVLANGRTEPLPATIIRAIYLHKHPEVFAGSEKTLRTTEGAHAFFDRIKSTDPLHEGEKLAILQAVYNFDRRFLKSLIAAMDICERGGGIQWRDAANVVICHDSYIRDHGKPPTNRQLLDLLKELAPGIVMERVTLADICKRQQLPLAKGQRGRPRKRASK